jgi:hypothetical protein
MGKWRGWRFKNASESEKRLGLLGVPSDMWKPLTSLRFDTFQSKMGKRKVTIEKESQHSWYEKLLSYEELQKGWLIGVGSENDDRKALHSGIDLVRSTLEESSIINAVKIVDCALIPPRNSAFTEVETESKRWWNDLDSAKIIIIHNILAEFATDERVQGVRDILKRCEEATRIVIVAGSNPVDFMVPKLCMTPDVALFIGNPVRRVVH